MEILKELDFSQYQEKIILALLEIKKGTATQIAKKQNIPTNKVYQIIKELIGNKLVIESPSSPKVYSLNNIEVRLKELIEEKRRKIQKIEKNYEEFLSTYEKESPSEEFWIFNDLNSIINKINETYSRLDDESIALIEIWESKYSSLKVTKKFIDSGKKVRFIGNVKRESIEHVKRWQKIGVEIRHNENISNAGFSVFDKKESKITIKKEKTKSIWSESEDFAVILQNYFELLWEKSQTVDEKFLNLI